MKSDNTVRKLNRQAGNHASLKIGEVAKVSGISIEALRFYERSGLLGKPARSQSGYRLYHEGILDRLKFIKKAQALGFSLDEIRQIIADAQNGSLPCDEVREIVRLRLAEVDARVKEMQRYRCDLAKTLEEWDRVGRSPGHVCGLIEASEMKAPLVAQSLKVPDKVRKK